jgi:hypothetical protein
MKRKIHNTRKRKNPKPKETKNKKTKNQKKLKTKNMLEEMVSENQIGVQNNGYYTLQHFCIENSSAHY